MVDHVAVRAAGIVLVAAGGVLAVVGVVAGKRRVLLAAAALLALAIGTLALLPHCERYWSYINGHCVPIDLSR